MTKAEKAVVKAAVRLAKYVAKRDYDGDMEQMWRDFMQPDHKAFARACAALLRAKQRKP